MNALNDTLNEQLKKAMAAVHHLDDLGATVFRIHLGGRAPVVEIDGEPERFVRGSLAARITINGMQRRTMVATVHGCRVEWIEFHRVGQRQVQ